MDLKEFLDQPPPRRIGPRPSGELRELVRRENASARLVLWMGAVISPLVLLLAAVVGGAIGAAIGVLICLLVVFPLCWLLGRWSRKLRIGALLTGHKHDGRIESVEDTVIRARNAPSRPGKSILIGYDGAQGPATCAIAMTDDQIELDALELSPGKELAVMIPPDHPERRFVVLGSLVMLTVRDTPVPGGGKA